MRKIYGGCVGWGIIGERMGALKSSVRGVGLQALPISCEYPLIT